MPAVFQRHILSRRFVTPAQLAVVTKHFLSASVNVRPLLVMSPYLSTAFVEGDVTGKNTCLYGLIKRGSGRIHPFEPERCLSFAEPG